MRKSSALIGLCVGVCLTLARPCDAEEKKPVPVYTNDDLERVRPFRDETGVLSKPAFPPTVAADGVSGRRPERPRRGAGGVGARGEEYWQSAAQRLREKLQRARDRADDLRLKIEERRRQPGVRPYSDPRIVADQRRLEVLERRIREAESSFEDRARRQGALPGWIR